MVTFNMRILTLLEKKLVDCALQNRSLKLLEESSFGPFCFNLLQYVGMSLLDEA